MTMTRSEHMEWCKERARGYLSRGNTTEAITSMLSDLSKHPETKEFGKGIAMLAFFELQHGGVESARRFIEGFN